MRMTVAGLAGVLATAGLMALLDSPRFSGLANRKKHQAVYYSILALFVLVSAVQILLRS